MEPSGEDLAAALEALRRGELVAFPTESSYGLAADPLAPAAVERLLAAKGRAPEQAIALVAADWAAVERLAFLAGPARDLARRHWPGPLTLVLPPRIALPAPLVGPAGVGIRISAHPWARALCAAFGGALTATSANRTGEPSARTAAQVRAGLGASVAVILDGGPLPGGPPSTVVAVGRDGRPQVLRAGALSIDKEG